MSLQRGTYGIEYDENPGSGFRKLWLPLILLITVMISALFFRGCGGDGQAAKPENELASARYRLPEVETERERPSLLKHWFFSKRAREAGTKPGGGVIQGRVGDAARSATAAALTQPPRKLPPEVQRLMEQVAEYENADDMPGARQLLLHLMTRRDADEVRAFVERKIGVLNTAMAFGDREMPEKARHKVVAGDVIGRLARRYGNTVDYILKVNGIDRPESLRVGRMIWVMQNPVFELTIFKRAKKAVLTLNGQFFKSYEVSLGKYEQLASGTYEIKNRVKKTAAYGQDPTRSSGRTDTRELVLSTSGVTPGQGTISLHGASDEFAFGQPPAARAVRFRTADIEEVFLLMRTGDKVNFTE
ncbi:MAG: LysM peptidoglycan-binding domain-containing protein [Kiritimatiellae bacterium]|nr:LysM peptidoglycan-binding domain-containing protein [Kiritimatiellia bacterium]